MDGLDRFDPTVDVCAAGVLVSGTAHLWRPSVGWGRRDLVSPQSVRPRAACHLLVHLPPRVLGCPSPRGAAHAPGSCGSVLRHPARGLRIPLWPPRGCPRPRLTRPCPVSPGTRPARPPLWQAAVCDGGSHRSSSALCPGAPQGPLSVDALVTECNGGPVAPVEGPWVGSHQPLLLPSPPAWRRGRTCGDAGRPATAP